MSTTIQQAQELFSHLRADIGDYPHWTARNVAMFLSNGTSEASIRAEYRIICNAYNEYILRARELVSRMRREIGERSHLDERTMLAFLDEGKIDEEIIESYRETEERTRASSLAKTLLADLQAKFGACERVNEKVVSRWLENLSHDTMVDNYKSERVKLLRARLEGEFGNLYDNSDKFMLTYVNARMTDQEVVNLLKVMQGY